MQPTTVKPSMTDSGDMGSSEERSPPPALDSEGGRATKLSTKSTTRSCTAGDDGEDLPTENGEAGPQVPAGQSGRAAYLDVQACGPAATQDPRCSPARRRGDPAGWRWSPLTSAVAHGGPGWIGPARERCRQACFPSPSSSGWLRDAFSGPSQYGWNLRGRHAPDEPSWIKRSPGPLRVVLPRTNRAGARRSANMVQLAAAFSRLPLRCARALNRRANSAASGASFGPGCFWPIAGRLRACLGG